jgi:hypothetical protein
MHPMPLYSSKSRTPLPFTKSYIPHQYFILDSASRTIAFHFNLCIIYQKNIMPPSSVDESDGKIDANRPEYTPLATALALHRGHPQDG